MGLRVLEFGRNPKLFEDVDPRLLVDNQEYTARFYSWRDEPQPVQKSNLFPAEKVSGRLRIFVVGGSTAQGYPFQRNHGFSGIAEAALRAVGTDVEVINVGNSAMSSYYVRETLKEVRAYDPDMVVVYAGHNEYYGTPSSFTGGNHALRLASLELRRYRIVQLLERFLGLVVPRQQAVSDANLMQRRFASALHPQDRSADSAVAALFVRNLEAGVEPLLKSGVEVAIFEPVSNLVSMPPFRSEGSAEAVGDPRDASSEQVRVAPREVEATETYRRLLGDLHAGAWDREAWETLKDRDAAPFRARSVLVDALEEYAREAGTMWIPTANELESRLGPWAFSDSVFIDHLHFNFDGQVLLAGMLARSVIDRFFFADDRLVDGLAAYLSDSDRVRADVHLTPFWEFEAYARVAALREQEPFVSMPIPWTAPPAPERVGRDPLFRGRDFIDSLEAASADDLFYLALDYYRLNGQRDEWIRNMNAYVHVFNGHHESHLAYGVALLEDGGTAYLEQAGAYIRRAYTLSGYDPEVRETAREALEGLGLSNQWERFRSTYLVEQ